METRSSKAAYLHGSFGAGKSHFMAALSLILSGNAQARSITELAEVIARHSTWTQGRNFLVVPYHMIGADHMESAFLGQYVEYVRWLHPDAPVPGFYLAEGLFRDATRLREQLGDFAFFEKLNAGKGASGWGARRRVGCRKLRVGDAGAPGRGRSHAPGGGPVPRLRRSES